jgi:hypothetical protein
MTIKRLAGALAAIGLVTATGSQGVGAINTYNAEPAPERTEVGALFVLWSNDDDDSDYERFDWVCSGTMIDDDTFLTAAHCTDDWPEGTRFFVSLDEDVQTPLDEAVASGLTPIETAELFLEQDNVVEGTPHQDEGFPGPASDSHDIAVIDFVGWDDTPQDVWDFTPATLPEANMLSAIGSRVLDTYDWWVMGYGTQEALRGPGGHTHPGGGVRLKALVDFNALNKSWIRLSMIEPRGYGGACYGDSGGPNFVEIEGQLILVATTITGDSPCYATNVVYRLDTEAAQAFLDDYVTLA